MHGINRINDKEQAIKAARVLKYLIEITEVSKLLTAFIPAFMHKTVYKMGMYFLHGNFNLGGAKSARMSSSNVNLQQLPSKGNPYAKDIKSCFQAPKGWIIVGADFTSMEDKISALLTKDRNKLKVYTDLYDGHCLRAFSYFGDLMPDIVNTLESINSIELIYPEIRQRSKTITFLLTYFGTFMGIMDLGFTEKKSKSIEGNFLHLYMESVAYMKAKLLEASKVGYVTCAFGLRLRTPILRQTILGTERHTPHEATSESRTAGNAIGQSYGLLNNRAANEFMEKVYTSIYKYQIMPIAHIHDAQYYMVKEDIELINWLNNNLVKCMSWQDLPEIQHDFVKIGAELEIYHPTMADNIKIPNYATKEEILDCVKK